MSTNRKRQPPPKRSIPKQYPTRTAELAASASDRYFVDIGGTKDADGLIVFSTAHYGIRDRESDTFDPRPGMSSSAVHAEVARLNAGLPVSRWSQIIGRKPPRTKHANSSAKLSAAGWVELLVKYPGTASLLQQAQDEGRRLSHDDVRHLMRFHERLLGAGPGGAEWLRLPTVALQLARQARPASNVRIENLRVKRQREADLAATTQAETSRAAAAERKLIDGVSKQLDRVLGIRRKESGRRNAWRSARRAERD